jgi:hypothetical protein
MGIPVLTGVDGNCGRNDFSGSDQDSPNRGGDQKTLHPTQPKSASETCSLGPEVAAKDHVLVLVLVSEGRRKTIMIRKRERRKEIGDCQILFSLI